MAAAGLLKSGYQASIAIIDVLLIEVATFLPNLVRIGQKLRERHQFFKLQDTAAAIWNLGELWWVLVIK